MIVAATSDGTVWSRSLNCPNIRGLWPFSFIRNSSPNRPVLTRCFPGSSRRPCAAIT